RAGRDRHDGPLPERQAVDDRRPIRGDQGAARRLLPDRGREPESRHRDRVADSTRAPGQHRDPTGARSHAAVAPTGQRVSDDPTDAARERVEAVYRSDSRRVLATLIRPLGDFDLAEEALHDAFAAAAERWPRDGEPANPRAWLVSAGRFKAIDVLRRRARFDA